MTNFHFVPVAIDVTRQRMIAASAWLMISVGAVFLFFLNPTSQFGNQYFPKCPFRFITGLQCPGCGSTRACYQLRIQIESTVHRDTSVYRLWLSGIHAKCNHWQASAPYFHTVNLSLDLVGLDDFLLDLS